MADNEEDQEIIDSSFELSTKLTEMEKSTLYYISGYVSFKEGCSVSAPDVPADNSEFLNYVSRGSLGHPPPDLYDFSQYIYAFFKAREKKWCPQVFLDAYQIIYESTAFKLQNVPSLCRRFNNCFIKAFIKHINDKLKSKASKAVKQRRISSHISAPL